MGEIRDNDGPAGCRPFGPIEVHVGEDDDTWNIIGEEDDECWYWEKEDGGEFVDALLELVMERARRR
jgi:hypothetical protein